MSMIGKTLGHYKIGDQPLGRGGMGEVYRAKDLKLGRDVAIKVLPEEFARDADRVARFQREAKLLASLNHPNIAAIHGLEEFGGTNFLVLELVEGETLADQLKRGPIPVEESLKLALQIAEALEAAHEKGVIHRDLKPANIKVTPEGKVKVLDFGLAKAFAEDQADLNLSNSPTLTYSPTLSNAATQQGVILGTAAYMPPEQARGKSVDKRADIWAFGCVLYEMLTGRQTWTGTTVTDIIAAALAKDPDFGSLPPNIHPDIRKLLNRCLQKDPTERFRDVGDVRVEIKQLLADPKGVLAQLVASVEPRMRLRQVLPWAAITLILIIIAGVAVWKLRPTEPRRVVRFDYELPEGQQFTNPASPSLAVSPDGSQFVYGTTKGLYMRSFDQPDARLVAGTDYFSVQPFFSPDGQWIAYFSLTDGKLKKSAVSGGVPVVLCDTCGLVTGASWDTKDTIVYSNLANGIMRISTNGGTPSSLVKGSIANMKEGFPSVPQMLRDGKTLLFTNAFDLNSANNQIVIQSLKSGEGKVLIKGGAGARYLSTGHIVYTLTNKNINNLFAVPFDLDKLEVTGGSVSILEGVGTAALSDSGTLVYVPQPTVAAATSSGSTLVWVNRQGKEEPLSAAPDRYITPRISPDGTKVALTVGPSDNKDIWIWDIVRGTMMRLTFDEGNDSDPVWTLDGKRIIYSSSRQSIGGQTSVWWKAADGTGEVEQFGSVTDRVIYPYSMSKDGKTLVVLERTLAPVQFDISIISMEGDHARKPLLHEKYNEHFPQISPDGRWMAYMSNESGKDEVYVRSFPDVNKGGRWQVSTNGGNSPLWSPNGRELFYLSADDFAMAVSLETKPTLSFGTPKVLFKNTNQRIGGGGPSWDIHPDGKRFLMIKPPASTGATPTAATPRPKINIVLNWFEELKQRVPTK